ncbi:MAG: GNAT family N-acetyltransferase, partial [Deltaproteobacteria bacterium]
RPLRRRLARFVHVGWRLAEHHPRAPHWHLFQLGVDPARQGHGLGRAIMEHAVALADADRVPAYLETSNPVNLPFYRRFGFEVLETLSGGGDMPPVWTMLRP